MANSAFEESLSDIPETVDTKIQFVRKLTSGDVNFMSNWEGVISSFNPNHLHELCVLMNGASALFLSGNETEYSIPIVNGAFAYIYSNSQENGDTTDNSLKFGKDCVTAIKATVKGDES